MWKYAEMQDPYGDDLEIPEEFSLVGRAYFARSPGSDIWVWFGDLPDATRDSLREKHGENLYFPQAYRLRGSLARLDDQSDCE
jgi:hypothetical protein